MTTWQTLIDAGAKACGSQNKLAKSLGTTSGNLSAARTGLRPLTPDQLRRLAEILGMNVGDVWVAQQDFRKPARAAEAAAIAVLSVLVLFTLPSESQASERVADGSTGGGVSATRYT